MIARKTLPSTGSAAVAEEGSKARHLSGKDAPAQLAATLHSAKSRPLDPDRIAALGAAQEVLAMAWDRAERDDAHDLAGPRLPENFSSERQQRVRMTLAAAETFNDAVAQYNDAIAQFPAVMLA